MPAIGITGHTGLPDDTAQLIKEALREALREHEGSSPHGITCPADGADQLFAQTLLEFGGTFEVVLPAEDYRQSVVAPEQLHLRALLARATTVSCMPFRRSNRRAYMAASVELIRRSTRIYAVWDGKPTRKLGSTADVVRAAREANLPVRIIWPDGARR